MASEALRDAMARFARAKGLPMDGAAQRSPRLPAYGPTHGTAAQIVAAEIERGHGDMVPSGLLEMAGVTRAGADAAAERLARAAARAGVPEAFRSVPPDCSRNALLGAAEPRGVWVSGTVGTGKTRQACAWLLGWLSAHDDGAAAFVTEADMLGRLHGAMARGSATDPDALLAAWELADLLVLDDVGQGRPGQWDASQVFRLVDARWRAMRPTIFTSNLTLPEWGQRLAQVSEGTARAVVSRVAGSCDQLVCGGMDRRIRR